MSAQNKLQPHGIYLGTPMRDKAGLPVCFMFPGHGAQYADMLAGLADEYPVVADAFARIDAVYERLTGETLTGRIYGEDAAKNLEDPEVMQPSIFAASMAVLRLLQESGYEPEAVVGHSLGEFGALVAADALSLEDGVVATHGRGVAVKTIPPERRGAMLSVHIDSQDTAALLERLLVMASTREGHVARSVVNSPEQTVLSGDATAIDAIAARCKEAGVKTTKLRVSHGFHSGLLAPAVPVLEKTLSSLDWQAPKIPVLSTVFGDYYRDEDVARIPALLAGQLVTPFSFDDLVNRLYARGIRVFIEVGPKNILSGLVPRILADREAFTVPTNVKAAGAVESIKRFKVFAEVHGIGKDLSGIEPRPVASAAGASPEAATATAAAPASAAESADGASASAEAAGAVTADPAELLELVSQLTGFPPGLLGEDKRMGADLGFSGRVRNDLVRGLAEHLGVRAEAVETDTETTLGQLFAKLGTLVPDSGPVAEAEDTAQAAAPTATAGMDLSEVSRVVMDTAQAKTGYPEELLELDLELEADLGIDSVKQAEILGSVREHYELPEDIEFDLATTNTLRKVIEFVAGTITPAPAGSVEAPQVDLTEVSRVVMDTAQAKTGYPEELLELDLELEADLGIDSVKQAEILGSVREHYELPEDIEFDLATTNTLRKVIEFVGGVIGDQGAPTERADQVPQVDLTEVSRVVMDTAQAKTGYPEELLELDLELEADLGIDSVKQAEILGSVREHYELPEDIEFDLATTNTLRKVIEFVGGFVGEQEPGTETTAEAAPAYTPILDRELECVTQRYVPIAVERPLAPGAERAFSLRDKGVVIIADRAGELAEALQPLLTDAGARVKVVGTESTIDPDGLRDALAAARDELAGADGKAAAKKSKKAGKQQDPAVQVLVNLYGFAPGDGTLDASSERWATEADARFTVELLAAQACYPDLGAAKSDGGYFAATTVGGSFGTEGTGDLYPLGGLTAGFVKSLARELPGIKAKVVDFDDPSPAVSAKTLFDEITTASEPNVEISYAGGARKILLVLPHELETNELQQPLKLTKDDVIVVSGGSRGITYECARELVAAYGPTLVILGRTTPPEGDEDWLSLSDEEFAAKRPEFLLQAKRDNPKMTPVTAEKAFSRLASRRTLHRNLAALRELNPEISYEPCDVADVEQTAAALGRIRERYGKITGVIHGAGLQYITHADRKRLDQALNLVRVKVNGAYNLWHAAKDDELRFFCLIGSILGRFGMDGQVDYTAAADVMPKLSAQIARTKPDVRSFTIAYTAWAGTGMAEDETVRQVQEGERGLRFIGIEEGVQTFVRELVHGGTDPEALVFGDTGKNSWEGQDAALDDERWRIAAAAGPHGRIADRLSFPLVDEIQRHDANAVQGAKRLREETDLYLADHQVRGAGTFPGVLHVEAQAELSSLLCPDMTLVAAENIEFLRFVKHNPKFPLTLSLRAEVSEGENGRRRIGAEIRSDLVGAGDRVLEADRVHSRGFYWFAKRPPTVPEPGVEIPELIDRGEPMDLDAFYAQTNDHLAYGPTFRCVRDAWVVGDSGETVSEIEVPYPNGLLASTPSPRFMTLPIVIDNAWRSPLFWMFGEAGKFGIPVSIDLIRFYRSPLPTELVYTFSRVTKLDAAGGPIQVETQIIDKAGRLLCHIADLAVTLTGSS